MAYADLGAWLDDDGLDIPVPSTKYPDGHTYRVPSPDAATGLRLTALVNLGVALAAGQEVDPEEAAKLRLDDGQEREFLPTVLGAAYQQMLDDGVSWVRIQRVGRYALLHFTLGPEAATEAASKGGQSGEAPAPNRETRRVKPSRAGSSATARSTRSRGSTAVTKSPGKPAKAR